jgi:hypothetical protein
MKHLVKMSKVPTVAYTPPTVIKLQGVLDVVDRLLLAQRQAPWKAAFPIDWDSGDSGDSGTDTTTGTT